MPIFVPGYGFVFVPRAESDSTPTASRDIMVVHETFGPTTRASRAYTYAPKLVPVGSSASVRSVTVGDHSRVTLSVNGLVPRRAYDAHVHTKRCAADPAASGGHFKHDPKGPANAENEVWLGFRTDAFGRASSSSAHSWAFPTDGALRSVVIHDVRKVNGVQPRLACITLPFTS